MHTKTPNEIGLSCDETPDSINSFKGLSFPLLPIRRQHSCEGEAL